MDTTEWLIIEISVFIAFLQENQENWHKRDEVGNYKNHIFYTLGKLGYSEGDIRFIWSVATGE